MRHETNSESGYVMVATMFLVILIAAFSVAYLSASFQMGQSTTFENNVQRSRLAAEEGVHLSIAELKLGDDADGDGVGTLNFQGDDGRSMQVVATDLGGNLFRISSTATFNNTSQAVECLVEIIPPAAINGDARAAITAEGPVVTSGNINVDGRDWDEWGTFVVAPGVIGISSTDSISNQGSSTVGGVGIAPGRPAPAGTIEPFALWTDGMDNDADFAIDEELFDGIDNDGDGQIDEDTFDYPANPDVALGLSTGTLKQIAQASGTYFTSEAQLVEYIDSNGGDMPGGVVVYADFDTWLPVNLGNNFNDPPSIIVHHNSTGTSLMKNVHGAFRGLIMADFVEHINGDFVLVGAFMAFSDESIGNAFGNGGADVLYSSQVLGNLPGGNGTAQARILSWNRSSINL